MFHQYFQMASRIRKHYLSPRVLLCLLTGKFVPPINRKNLYSLQYFMLPARRSGIMEMWAAVNALAYAEADIAKFMEAIKDGASLRRTAHADIWNSAKLGPHLEHIAHLIWL
ncbi:pig-Q [Cytospora paraplurivora]|uniref:Pig-Q n=1 Tax=Cytospora paraplurivora TaxID=2898453 RepID=A0AAN9U6V1_9PEZI